MLWKAPPTLDSVVSCGYNEGRASVLSPGLRMAERARNRNMRPYLEYQADRVETVLTAHRAPGGISGSDHPIRLQVAQMGEMGIRSQKSRVMKSTIRWPGMKRTIHHSRFILLSPGHLAEMKAVFLSRPES